MKILKFLFCLLALFNMTISIQRICKTSILRSIGYHSRLTPNKDNSLCPRVAINCCTNHDQISMHKNWKTITEVEIKEHQQKALNVFKQLTEILSIKDKIDLNTLTQTFLEVTKSNPDTKIENHLVKLTGLWMKRDGLYYQEILNALGQKSLPNLYNDVLQLRKGSLCMLCDWHNQNYINVESLTVLYNQDFCMQLIDNHLDVLYDKYNTLFYTLMVLDEWVYLTSD